MKQADVKVGGQYLTRVGGELVLVEVVRLVPPRSIRGPGNTRTGFYVRRVGANAQGVAAVLPKARTAAALREVCPRTVTMPPRVTLP